MTIKRQSYSGYGTFLYPDRGGGHTNLYMY